MSLRKDFDSWRWHHFIPSDDDTTEIWQKKKWLGEYHTRISKGKWGYCFVGKILCFLFDHKGLYKI